MEVIMREDVKSLGRAGELVKVKDGYARNFLLPQGLAYEASEGNRKRIAAESKAREARRIAERGEAEAFAGRLAGASVGQAKQLDFRLDTDELDDTDVTWMALGGYQFFPWYALMGGYLDLGDYHAEGPSFGGYESDISVDGFYVRNLGILPAFSRVSFLGSLGVFLWDYEFNDLDIPSGSTRHLTDTGYSLTWGLGVNVDLAGSSAHFRGLNLHAGWERLDTVGDRDTVEHENDYDVFLLGLTYNFTR